MRRLRRFRRSQSDEQDSSAPKQGLQQPHPEAEQWKKTYQENLQKPRFGLQETLRQLENNEVTSVELTGWQHVVPHCVARSLALNRTLIDLSLQACKIGDTGMRELAPSFKHVPLEKLNLSGNGLTDPGAVALAEGLDRHPTLLHLILDWNGISDVGVHALAKHAMSPPLCTLSLAGVADGRGGGTWDNLLDPAQVRSGRCHISDEGCRALALFLPHATTLERLVLSRQVRITSQGIAALALAATSLKHLELQRLPLTDEGAEELARLLPTLRLESLDLKLNELTDRGATALAACLSRCPSLRRLALSQNAIGVEGLQAFGKAMSINPFLLELDVYGHEGGEQGSESVRQIARWLRVNKKVEQMRAETDACCRLCPLILSRLGRLPDSSRLFLFWLSNPAIVAVPKACIS